MEGFIWYKEESLRSAYFALIVFRFLWNLFPQTGYLYPDEFFQSPEIMARDLLSLNTTVTWEWNETFPVRSPVSAFLSSGVPYIVLDALCNINLVKLHSYVLLVFPRIYMTLLSLLSFDIPVYMLCRRLNLHPFSRLIVLSTSYVTLVFGSRPFSNVLETSILGILLILLIPPGNKKHCQRNGLSTYETLAFEISISNMQCILAGGLTSIGLFCRQTFPVFALIPFVGFFISQLRWSTDATVRTKIMKILTRMMLIVLGFSLVSFLIVIGDSWYFGYIQKGNVVLTPWNFIKYNTMYAHKHGHHAVFTHFFINIPLLFGPIAILWYFKLASLLLQKILKGYSNYQQDRSVKNHVELDYNDHCQLVLVFTVVVPVLLLSFIPHQEPRFIMPIILPLILLLSPNIVGPKCSPVMLTSWCIWNIIGSLFFGVFHQGGVIPSLLHLEKLVNDNFVNTSMPFCQHVVYFHTYMPPTHLLAWPNRISTNNGHQLYIHDLAGHSQEVFHQTKSKIETGYCDKDHSMLYVVCPGTVQMDIEGQINVQKFFPHLTMEDPPDFNYYLTEMIFGSLGSAVVDPGSYSHENKSSNTQLNLWQKLEIFLHNYINQAVKLKSELTLNLYVSKL